MKFNNQRQIVKYDGVLESSDFKIQMGPKIFSILSGAIYSDIVLALVREYSQNAKDSHKEAGTEKTPFDVTLPTTWNCQFIIRDYGVGLSPDRIKEIFTTYGASTKDTSNDYTGMLGIGCKSAFAYHTKSFTLESWYDGVHSTYSAHIGEDLLPKLVKLSEESSTDKTGVKIVIPCNQNDIYNFQQAAIKVYTWFDPKPKISGASILLPKVESILKGDSDWELRKSDYNIYSGAMAIMGDMIYPISFQDSSLNPQLQALITTPVTLKFNLGDVDVAASRESLSYDVKTKNNIIARFKLIIDELNARVEKEVQACKSLFEARQKVGQVLSKLPSGSLRNCIDLNKVYFNKKELFPKGGFNMFDLSLNIPAKFNLTRIEKSWNNTPKVTTYHAVSYMQNFCVIEADLKNSNQARAKEFFATNIQNYQYVFLVTFVDAKEKDELIEFLGCEAKDIILASTLPKPIPPARVQGNNVKVTTTKVMKYNGGNGTCSYCWNAAQKDLKKDAEIWVELNTYKYRVPWAKNHHEPRTLSSIIESLNILGKINNTTYKDVKEVYGLKTAFVSQIDKTKWTNLFDLVKKEIDLIIVNNDFLTAMELGGNLDIGGYHNTYRRYTPDYTTLNKISSALQSKNPKHEFISTISTIQKYKGFHSKYENAIKAFNVLKPWVEKAPVLKPVKVEKPNRLVDELYKKYTLLPHIEYSSPNLTMTIIADYLEKIN